MLYYLLLLVFSHFPTEHNPSDYCKSPISSFVKAEQDTMDLPEQLVQAQLDAYNQRDIDAFLKPYSDDVEVYTFPDTLQYKGKANMKTRYAKLFAQTPDLHCTLVNRIVMGNTVIDQEKVTGFGQGVVINAIAIYKIENNKIAKVYFIK